MPVKTPRSAGGWGDIFFSMKWTRRSGNILMYYPEANILVPRNHDKKSKTPSFKSVSVEIIVED